MSATHQWEHCRQRESRGDAAGRNVTKRLWDNNRRSQVEGESCVVVQAPRAATTLEICVKYARLVVRL